MISGIANSIFELLSLGLSIVFSWPLLLFFSFLAYAVLKDRKIFLVFFGLLLTTFLTTILKFAIAAPRPPFGKIDTMFLSYSYPSGHTALAFFLAAVFSFFYPKSRYVVYLIAVLVAFSRVFLGVHYLIDIIGGVILGLSIAFIVIANKEDVYFLEKKLNKLIKFS